MREQIEILGVAVDNIDFAATLDQIGVWVGEHRAAPTPPNAPLHPGTIPICRQICTVNPEFIIDADRNPTFAAVLSRADLRVPDGVGVLWAARRFGHPLAERVTGSDGIYRITARAAAEGWRVFFLGAAPGVAMQTAEKLRGLYPELIVAGVHSGSPRDEDWPTISAYLASTKPDILFVAFGHPRQDYWIDQHRAELPAAVAIGVGGAFDFVAGITVRAPLWVQKLGLEWLHRLWCEPWRWRRMMKLPVFAVRVVRQHPPSEPQA